MYQDWFDLYHESEHFVHNLAIAVTNRTIIREFRELITAMMQFLNYSDWMLTFATSLGTTRFVFDPVQNWYYLQRDCIPPNMKIRIFQHED